MQTRVAVNEEVNITEVYFKNKKNLKSFPKRMEYQNEEYTFIEGLQYLVQKGQQAIQLFDMTDGANKYRLKFDDQQFVWTLISISAEPRAL
jgi:hypothetical protein